MKNSESIAVLVLDDETRLADEIGEYLESKGFSVFIADRPSKAFQILHSKPIHIAMVDIKLPEYDGLTFLRKLRAEQSDTEIIIMSGHGDMESVIEALRLGAFDYLRKPFSSLELQAAISRISRFLEVQQSYRRSSQRCMELQDELFSENELIGHSSIMEQIREMIQRAAQFSDTAVLIRGESGTGKELVARQIHRLSSRASGSFVPVNCAAIPRDMFESEFFGHEKGAFTDAQVKRNGLFRTADGGTLFLDEIGEIPFELQSKLLRALEEKKVRPLGMDKELSADVRIIGATNRDLLEEVRQGRFRKDLYYRIAVMDIHVPPLRERREDIPDLIDYFYRQSCLRSGRPFRSLSANIIDQLLRYDFPGNIRELKNLVERIVILGREPQEKDLNAWLDPEHCGCTRDSQSQTADLLSGLPPVLNLETIEKALIMRAMEQAQGVQSTAAQLLGITRQALDRRLKKYQLRP
ncbi:sigma-54 dependent transcriptional regulator [Gracilinema caldarium]|uniref:sigma-54-dependent transcriptional regulator n=1 Tax=Gracilinema caldarium TaxID=215591 RepID=UPI0026EDD9C7|nr:sigma-54 dependent transcriptional regulator [Gracilinema caldarium]